MRKPIILLKYQRYPWSFSQIETISGRPPRIKDSHQPLDDFVSDMHTGLTAVAYAASYRYKKHPQQKSDKPYEYARILKLCYIPYLSLYLSRQVDDRTTLPPIVNALEE